MEALLGINREDKLLLEAANYIASKVEISPLGLQKNLYYIQMFYSGFNNKALFFSRCNAWNHGPVFGKVYYKYKKFGSGIIDETEDMTYDFDEDLKRLIDVVVDNFACYSGQVLTYFTHSELPWIEAYETDDKIIEKQVMKDYALLIFEEHNIKNVKDIYKYSEFKFKQYKNRISI
jgi:uncharacterized phage-associated protein